ncbi:MAG: glucose-1-phosphate thymidylyltransferase [Chlorobi bacterium CHB2]|nr:glucose-1-phosphate thymidylyltransferase [Chlorobi bacterium CHB2]
MKALITAGGRGTRLRPITHTQNKHLIPIANKPILQYALDAVKQAGITEIGIVVGVDNGHEVERAFGDGSQQGVAITYIWQEAPLGLAHVVKISQEFIGDDSFVFYLGDNIVVGGIERFVEKFQQGETDCLLTLARVRDPERFGVPEFDNQGKIIGVAEKPNDPKSPFAVSGIYFYNSSIFAAVNAIQPSSRGELEISDAHDYLLKHGYRVGHSEITGWWKDTGMPSDLLEANRLVLSKTEESIEGKIDPSSDIAGAVIIEEGAEIINSRVRGPAIIGHGTKIMDSYVGPYSAIGNSCELEGCEVEYSILMDRVRLNNVGVRVEGSILANDVEIVRAAGKPRVQRFMLGEQSRIELV